MARGALLTGTVGAIIGSITGGIGIVWSIVDMLYIAEISNVFLFSGGGLYTILNISIL
nr:hypothetical protein [Candidatus Freyarchaeota archaeon]